MNQPLIEFGEDNINRKLRVPIGSSRIPHYTTAV